MKRIILPITALLLITLMCVAFQSIDSTKSHLMSQSALNNQSFLPEPVSTPLAEELRPAIPLPARNTLRTPSQDSETEDFFNLVTNSETREEVFATPGRHVIATRDGNRWIAQGDLLVPRSDLMTEESEAGIAKLSKTKYWPDNKVPYRIETGFDARHVLKAIEIMNHQTPLRFVEHTNEDDYIFFPNTDSARCLSYLGRQGGRQEILVNPQKCGAGNVLHEIMHAIGFGHEHSREDRDNFIEVHWDHIDPAVRDQFQKLRTDLSPTTLPFDFDSIMLYSSRAFTTGEYPSMTKRDGSWFDSNRIHLSQGDVDKINAVYAP